MSNRDSFENNGIWSAAGKAALLGGAAYAFYKNKRSFAQTFSGGNMDVIGRATGRLYETGSFKTAERLSKNTAAQSHVMSMLNLHQDASSMKTVASDLQQSAYQALSRSGDKKVIWQELKEVVNQSNIQNAFTSASRIVEKHGGSVSDFSENFLKLTNYSTSYPSSRLSALNVMDYSSGNLASGSHAKSLGFGELSETAASRAARFRDIGHKTRYYEVSENIGGKTIKTPMMKTEIMGTKVNVPLEDTKFTYSGKNLTTNYVTRQAYMDKNRIIPFGEFYSNKLIEAAKTGKSIKDVNKTVFDVFQEAEQKAGSAALWTLPEPAMTAGGRVKARMNLFEAVSFHDLDPDEIEDIVGDSNLRPYTSPNSAAKGVLTTRDMTTDLYGSLGRFMRADQRPTQGVRDWSVTRPAKDLAVAKGFKGKFGQHFSRLDRKIKGPMYDKFFYGSADVMSEKAYSSPQLLTFYAKPASSGMGIGYASKRLNEMLPPEQGYISENLSSMLEHERVVQKTVALDEGVRAHKGLLEALQGRKTGEYIDIPAESIGAGDILGIDKSTGKEITNQFSESGGRRAFGAKLIDQNTAKIYMKENFKLSEGDYWKFFSEENKFLGTLGSRKKMQETLKAAGGSDYSNLIEDDIEAFFSGKMVARNKTALVEQQIEAISAIGSKAAAEKRLSLRQRQALTEFMENPTGYFDMDNLIKQKDMAAFEDIESNLVKFSQRKMKFKREELGAIFGLMDTDTAGKLGIKDIVEESPGVLGLSKFKLGDLATEGGSGRRASFEQTGFRMLAAKGESGLSYAAELSKRIKDKDVSSGIDLMTRSLLGLDKKPSGEYIVDAAKLSQDNLFRETGTTLNLGQKVASIGNTDKIYLPSKNQMASFIEPFVTDEGDIIKSDIENNLMGLTKAVKNQNTEQIEKAAARLRDSVFVAGEKQTAARGKILGSQFLTGIRRATHEGDAFRVAPDTAKQMYRDLIERSSGEEQEFLERQLDDLLHGKRAVGGMWRHPTTGPESFQFAEFEIDKSLKPGLISAPAKFGKLKIGDELIDIDASEMVGYKGDFDNDKFALSVISSKGTADRVRSQIKTDNLEKYNQYLFNHYSLKKEMTSNKISEASNQLSYSQRLKSEYRDLTTAKTTTGRVNLALQKLKLGVQAQAPNKYRPLAELFWHLEESAITKHGASGKNVYGGITQAVEEGGETGARMLEEVMTSLFGPAKKIQGEIDVGGKVTRHTFDFNPKELARSSMEALDIVRERVDAAVTSSRIAKKGSTFNKSLPELVDLYKARKNSVDVSQALLSERVGGAQDFVTKASKISSSAKIRARTFTSALSKSKAPLLAGAGVAAAIALSAGPSVSGVLPQQGDPKQRLMGDSDLGPPHGHNMHPPEGGPLRSPRQYEMSSLKQSSYVNMRMNNDDFNSTSRDFLSDLRAVTNGDVNTSVEDNRQILTPATLARNITERL